MDLLRTASSLFFGATERARALQLQVLDLLQVPSTEEVKQLERRLRTLNTRAEELEDRVDELGATNCAPPGSGNANVAGAADDIPE